MEAEKTLTFPFGGTPEDVIRERHSEGRTWADITADDSPQVAMVCAADTDQLLTVLDALEVSAYEYDRASVAAGDNNDPDEESRCAAIGKRSRNLRISILAALGITES